MPQMSPLSWWTLMLFFVLMLIMICIMNYFIMINKPLLKDNNISAKNPTLTWKW
uniref:ATP synthase F0 subunit 8 n=1 Tax=Halter nutans TaxID=1593350 RepID=UPI003001DA4C|nr:ATP synthase F0 subunit 8 [Halter nutans]